MTSLRYDQAIVKAVAHNVIDASALKRIRNYCPIHSRQLIHREPDRCLKCLEEQPVEADGGLMLQVRKVLR